LAQDRDEARVSRGLGRPRCVPEAMGSESSCCCKGPPPEVEEKDTCTGTQGTQEEDTLHIVMAIEETENQSVRRRPRLPTQEISHEEDEKRRAAARGVGRRAAVAAEAVSSYDLKDYVKPVFKKDAATEAKIANSLRTNDKLQVLFGHLDKDTMQDVVNAFEEVTFKKGQDIIIQGDEGDCLYLLADGSVDVFVARPGADGKVAKGDRGSKVVTLGPGALFGELALMYSAPRAATVIIASPECRAWKLDRTPFKMLLAQQTQSTLQLYEGWLSRIEILKPLNQFELARLSEMLESTLLDAGEEIIRQGDPGDKFYIVEDGTCAAFISGPNGEVKVKDYVKRGEYFGEIALLSDEPRKATVRATGDGCAVVSVSKEDFTNVLGPIAEKLAKQVDKYPQYAQLLGQKG